MKLSSPMTAPGLAAGLAAHHAGKLLRIIGASLAAVICAVGHPPAAHPGLGPERGRGRWPKQICGAQTTYGHNEGEKDNAAAPAPCLDSH